MSEGTQGGPFRPVKSGGPFLSDEAETFMCGYLQVGLAENDIVPRAVSPADLKITAHAAALLGGAVTLQPVLGDDKFPAPVFGLFQGAARAAHHALDGVL